MSQSQEFQRFKYIFLFVVVLLLGVAVWWGVTHEQRSMELRFNSSQSVQFTGRLKAKDLGVTAKEMGRMTAAVGRHKKDVEKLYVLVSKMTEYEDLGPDTRLLCELVLVTEDGRKLNAPPFPTTRAKLVDTVLRRLRKQTDALRALDSKRMYEDRDVETVVNPM